MGYPIKFNWVLQLEPPERVLTETTHSFRKAGSRVFPTNVPIDLIDLQRNAVAKIKIKWFTNQEGVTSGEFEVIKVYAGQEKVILSNYWVENQ